MEGWLVFQKRALGGQGLLRNGRNYKGGTVLTGVYLVLVSDDTPTKKTAAKIVFVKKRPEHQT
jgi:hypothetical protein